jgi:hypothetical protein
LKSLKNILLAAVLIAAVSACTGTSEPTVTPTPTPADTATPIPTATETEILPASETPEPTATAVPTESGEFISPYTPSVPTGSGASLDPIELQLDLQEGAIYRIRFLTSQDLSQSFEGQSIDISQKVGFEYTYTVTGREPDGSAWVDVMYTRAVYEMDIPFGTESYDSADPPGQIPEGAEGFAAIVGTGFAMKVASDGEILEIVGLEEMYEQMVSEMDLTDPELRQAFDLTFRDQFSEQAMKDQMGNLLFEFPEGSIGVGDSWTSTQESSVMFPVVAENTYTLLDFDESTALIEVRSEIRAGTDEGGMDADLFGIEFTIIGSQEGLIEVDLNTGLPNSNVDQVLTGEMTLVVEGEQITVPLNILQTVQVESVQLAP